MEGNKNKKMKKHTPEFIPVGNFWEKNTGNIECLGKPLFTTICGTEIFHGDTYWVHTNEAKTDYNMVIASKKFDYDDGKERFKTKEQAQDAIQVFNWLNNPTP